MTDKTADQIERDRMRSRVRSNVRNAMCGLTEAECHEMLETAVESNHHFYRTDAIREWIAEGEFWTSSWAVEERIGKEMRAE